MKQTIRDVFRRAEPLSREEEIARDWIVSGKKPPREGAWHERHDIVLRDWVARGLPREEIAKLMNRTNMSVRKRIQSLRRSGFIEAVK